MARSGRVRRLEPGEYGVVCAALATGIVLDVNGGWSLDGVEYSVYSSLPEAVAFAKSVVEANPLWESSVRDCAGNVLEAFRHRPPDVQSRLKRRRWWQRWFIGS